MHVSGTSLGVVHEVLDPADVPPVGARELALALRILSAGRGLVLPEALDEGETVRLDQEFWQISPRHRTRKAAVLLRLRCLLVAARSRRLRGLLEEAGESGLVHALAAAARLRLNARWGLNPLKVARAVEEALAAQRGARAPDAASPESAVQP